MKIILCCGDRNWTNKKIIDQMLSTEKPDAIIEGGCIVMTNHGPMSVSADFLAGEWADSHGIPHFRCSANWGFYKKAAGPIRNGWMIKFMKVSKVIAFHNDIKSSKGTANMLKQAKKAGIKTKLVTEKD